MSQYPEDEFDIAGRGRSPEGVHREVRPVWRTLLPYALVVVLVPLLAFGAFQLFQGGDGDQPTSAPSETTAPEPTDEPSDEASDEATDDETSAEPSETPEETTEPEPDDTDLGADVIETTTISVLNGAGVDGLAGDAAAQLEDAGFTSVSATDYTAGSPDVTTLYYRNADLEATAQAAAEELGITNVVELAAATQNAEIAIVLRADFAD